MYPTCAQDKSLWRALVLAGVLASLVMGVPVGAWAQTYTFTTIDVPGAFYTQLWGINNAGQIVGAGQFPNEPITNLTLRGFVYTGGSFSMIDVPSGTLTQPAGINDAGEIVGGFIGADGLAHGFVYIGGSFTTLDVPFPGAPQTLAYGINNTGQIVGTFTDTIVPGPQAFVDTEGSFSTIDPPAGIGTFTEGHGVNDTGQIVGVVSGVTTGVHGFLYTGGTFSTIDVPGSHSTQAGGINNRGQIVGVFADATGQHGFLKSGDSFITIDFPGGRSTALHGINDRGQIVGNFTDATATSHGFLATPIPTSPPAITVSATPTTLWPPNGRLVTVTVSGTITDADSRVDPDTAIYEVTDEYGIIQPSDDITLDANGNYIFTIQLQASRNGNDRDGRHYTITVSALDTEGNEGSADAIVTVPHDQGQSQSIATR